MGIPLIFLLGFPGAGKTTLAKAMIKKNPSYRLVQVFEDYMKDKYIGPRGEILAINYVIKAHDQLYRDLNNMETPTIIELGTNYPRYNCKKIKKLSLTGKFQAIVVFCLLDKGLCEKRYQQGFAEGYRRIMQKPLLTERMKRHFPKIYQIHCRNFGLPILELAMEKPIEENMAKLEQTVK